MSKLTKNKINQQTLSQLKEFEINFLKLKDVLKQKDETIKALEKELNEKDKKISALENQLGDSLKTEESELENIKLNFLNRYSINMTYIDNLKVIAHYRFSDNPRDEYSAYHSGELELSYDYIKDSNFISVKYTANYNYSQSYENRYDPYVEFDSKLNVSPNIKFTYDKDVKIYYTNPKYDDEDDIDEEYETEWCNLINKVLEEIDCDTNNFSEIVCYLTNDGKININK